MIRILKESIMVMRNTIVLKFFFYIKDYSASLLLKKRKIFLNPM